MENALAQRLQYRTTAFQVRGLAAGDDPERLVLRRIGPTEDRCRDVRAAPFRVSLDQPSGKSRRNGAHAEMHTMGIETGEQAVGAVRHCFHGIIVRQHGDRESGAFGRFPRRGCGPSPAGNSVGVRGPIPDSKPKACLNEVCGHRGPHRTQPQKRHGGGHANRPSLRS